MRKELAITCCALLAAGLVACGGSDAKNGTYTAQTTDSYAAENSNGFRDVLVVKYEDGNIVSVELNSYDVASGTSKLDMEYPMDPPPSEWMPELENGIRDNGKVDTVAGATNTSKTVEKLLAAIEKDGVAGGTVEVDN